MMDAVNLGSTTLAPVKDVDPSSCTISLVEREAIALPESALRMIAVRERRESMSPSNSRSNVFC